MGMSNTEKMGQGKKMWTKCSDGDDGHVLKCNTAITEHIKFMSHCERLKQFNNAENSLLCKALLQLVCSHDTFHTQDRKPSM